MQVDITSDIPWDTEEIHHKENIALEKYYGLFDDVINAIKINSRKARDSLESDW